MSGWIEFSLALVAFLAAHVLPMKVKTRLTTALGRRGYVIAYSALSLALLYWLILASGRAPYVELWPQPVWSRWLVNLVMSAAFIIGAIGGFGGVMIGFSLWAGSHLIANGDLAHVLFFGLLLGYAVTGLMWGARLTIKVTPLRIGIGVAAWAALFHLHPLLIGMSPLP